MAKKKQAPSSTGVEVVSREFRYLPAGVSVRVVRRDGMMWFVAKDVAAALGIAWTSRTLDRIKAAWRGVVKLITPLQNQHGSLGGQEQEVVVITEAAVYKLAFRSNKPEAEAFTDWVAEEVLPAIRQTGRYEIPGRLLPIVGYSVRPYSKCGRPFNPLIAALRQVKASLPLDHLQTYHLIDSELNAACRGLDPRNARGNRRSKDHQKLTPVIEGVDVSGLYELYRVLGRKESCMNAALAAFNWDTTTKAAEIYASYRRRVDAEFGPRPLVSESAADEHKAVTA